VRKTLRLLLPPGLGDIHWVALKLRAWLEREDADARVWVLNHDGRPRGLEYVRRLPFVRTGHYYNPGCSEIEMLGDAAFRSCYYTGEREVLRDFLGFDAFLCFNGSLLKGRSIDYEILPDCLTEWDYPVREMPEDRDVLQRMPTRKFILFGLSDFTIFGEWVRSIGEGNLRRLLKEIPRQFPGTTPVLTGASWDAPLCDRLADVALNLAGKTSVGELLALMRRADAFVGFAGGNGVVATHLACPTVILWHRAIYPEPKFRHNWVEPEKRGRAYQYMEADQYDHEVLMDMIRQAMACEGRVI
jgi:hypothetical protein